MEATTLFTALARLDLPFYEYAGEFCKLAAATAWDDTTLNKLFLLWANCHRPVDLPDTTGLSWREAVFRCLGSVRARARTSPPSSAAPASPPPFAAPCSPPPSVASSIPPSAGNSTPPSMAIPSRPSVGKLTPPSAAPPSPPSAGRLTPPSGGDSRRRPRLPQACRRSRPPLTQARRPPQTQAHSTLQCQPLESA